MQTEDVPDQTPVQQAAEYIEQLRSPLKETREQALAALKQIGPDRILDLLLKVEWEDQKHIQGWVQRIVSRLFVMVIAILLSMAGLLTLFMRGGTQSMWLSFLPFLGLGALLLPLFQMDKIIRESFRLGAVWTLLLESEDTRVVGALCESLRRQTHKWNGRAINDRLVQLQWSKIEALIRLLPRLQPDHPDLPSAKHREFLRTTLEKRSRTKSLSAPDIRLVSALLQYVMNMGDLHALPTVERLALRQATSSHEAEMITQANLCLQTLQDLQQRSRQSDGLLRGSEAPAVQARELLRGVTAGQTEATELLRAGGDTAVSTPVEPLRTVVVSDNPTAQETLQVGNGRQND